MIFWGKGSPVAMLEIRSINSPSIILSSAGLSGIMFLVRKKQDEKQEGGVVALLARGASGAY
jgi:hypothetical protein